MVQKVYLQIILSLKFTFDNLFVIKKLLKKNFNLKKSVYKTLHMQNDVLSLSLNCVYNMNI
jgi:hypothetical protein